MRRATPDESLIGDAPILVWHLSEAEFARLFPVEMDQVDPLAWPEPAIGGIVQLKSGQYLGIIYGKATERLYIHIPSGQESAAVLEKLFEEIPLSSESVVWQQSSEKTL